MKREASTPLCEHCERFAAGRVWALATRARHPLTVVVVLQSARVYARAIMRRIREARRTDLMWSWLDVEHGMMSGWSGRGGVLLFDNSIKSGATLERARGALAPLQVKDVVVLFDRRRGGGPCREVEPAINVVLEPMWIRTICGGTLPDGRPCLSQIMLEEGGADAGVPAPALAGSWHESILA